jgi:hypothetical protein
MLDPKLKGTILLLSVARKRGMRLSRIQRFHNLLIRDVTHLVILIHHQASLVAHTTFAFRHEHVAYIVSIAYIAVHTTPALFAFASLTPCWCAIFPIC